AAAVGHLVDAVAAVGGGVGGADVLAGCLLAVLAGHGLIHHRGIVAAAAVVPVHPQPVHLAVATHVLRPHHRDVVLGLAGDHAGAAAGAGVEIDDHAPLRTRPRADLAAQGRQIAGRIAPGIRGI